MGLADRNAEVTVECALDFSTLRPPGSARLTEGRAIEATVAVTELPRNARRLMPGFCSPLLGNVKTPSQSPDDARQPVPNNFSSESE
jgi:hypothetical protein